MKWHVSINLPMVYVVDMVGISMVPWFASTYGKKKTSAKMDLLQTISSRTPNKTIPIYVFISVKCWNLTSPPPRRGCQILYGRSAGAWENDHNVKLCIVNQISFATVFYIEKNLDVQQTIICIGFECADGWFELLVDFSKEVVRINEIPMKRHICFVASQIKEKFGEIRVNWHTKSFPGMCDRNPNKENHEAISNDEQCHQHIGDA